MKYDMNNENFQRDSENLIKGTMKLEFPFLAGDEKKQEILSKDKLDIDTEIDCMIEKYQIRWDNRISEREKIWDSAKAAAEKKFNTLPVSLRMNSFFLQELMHGYAENQVVWVRQALETEN